MNGKMWTEEENNIIIKYYGQLKTSNIRDSYLPHRSIASIRNQASNLSVKYNIKLKHEGPNKWTADRIKTLKDNYAFMTVPELHNLMPEFTENAIRIKACNMGFPNKYIKAWNQSEINCLIKNYKSMSCKKLQETYFPDRTVDAISDKVILLGLSAKHHKWTPEDDAIIRKYAKQIKIYNLRSVYFPDVSEDALRRRITKVFNNTK